MLNANLLDFLLCGAPLTTTGSHSVGNIDRTVMEHGIVHPPVSGSTLALLSLFVFALPVVARFHVQLALRSHHLGTLRMPR